MVATSFGSVSIVVFPRSQYGSGPAQADALSLQHHFTILGRIIGLTPTLPAAAAIGVEGSRAGFVGLGQHVTVIRAHDDHPPIVPGCIEQRDQCMEILDPELVRKRSLAKLIIDRVDDDTHHSGPAAV